MRDRDRHVIIGGDFNADPSSARSQRDARQQPTTAGTGQHRR
ncbi:endonuclease/exonuclease/phosphatase family protein [Micromonospora coerulea]